MSRYLPSTIHDRLKPIGNNRRVVHIAALVVAIYGFVIVADTLTSYSVGSFSFSAVAPKMPNKPVASVTFPERYKHDESCHVPTWAKVVTTKTTPSFKIAIYKNHDHSGGIVSEQIESSGGWEQELWPRMVQHLSTPSDTTSKDRVFFIDVGANIGFFTLFAAALGADVVAFEPSWANAQMIQASVCLNRFNDRVQLYNIGLSARPLPNTNAKPTDLVDGYEHNELTMDIGQKKHWEDLGIVSELRFDRMARYLPTDRRADLMKIDIEGYEQNAIESGLLTFRQTGAPIAVLTEVETRFTTKGKGLIVMGIEQEGHRNDVKLGTYFWGAFAKEFGCSITAIEVVGVTGWFWARWRLIGWLLLKLSKGSNLLIDCDLKWRFEDYCLAILVSGCSGIVVLYGKKLPCFAKEVAHVSK